MDSSLLIENIKRISKAKGIAPTNACKESGVGTSFIPDIKRGQIPSVAKVQMLADYLGVTTSDLLGEKIPPVSEDDGRLDSAFANANEQTREAIELMSLLTPENLEKAKDYIRFELARQGDTGDKQ